MPAEQPRETAADPADRLEIACPSCGQIYRISRRLLGRRMLCKNCRVEWRSEVSPRIGDGGGDSSGQTNLDEDVSSSAGSSSIVDTSWAGRKLGKYRVISMLGKGGMGVVWRGHDDTLRRDVALKILTPDRNAKPDRSGLNMDLFMQEARAVAKLQHPSVVSIFEVAEDQDQQFLALELMEGGNLKEYIDRTGPIAPRELFKMMTGPARALDVAHRRGIIHRDIKPSNFMFDDHGHLKLGDFGLADVANERVSAKLRGRAVGSLGWIAPETAKGQATTAASDIYSFGLVMVYALRGRPWLNAKSRTQMLALHQSPPPLDLSNIEGLTPISVDLLEKCLAIDPQIRFPDAQALVDALTTCANEPLEVLAPYTPPKRPFPVKAVVAGIAAFVVLLVVGAFVVTNMGDGGGDQDRTPLSARPTEPGNGAARSSDSGSDSGRTLSHRGLPTPVQRPRAAPVQQVEKSEPPPSLAPAPIQPSQAPESPAQPSAKSPATQAPLKFSPADARRAWPEVLDASKLKFIASENGQVFHLPTCEGGRKIFMKNLVLFDTLEEAEASGRKPCPYCHPDHRK